MSRPRFSALLLMVFFAPGVSNAATNADSVSALMGLPDVNPSWVISNEWKSLDTRFPGAAHTALWDFPITLASDPCGEQWAGIYCDGADITHIEVPNAQMNGTLASVFSALEPIKAQLVSLNLSSTQEGDQNTLTGGIPTDSSALGYVVLQHLALNNIGASGEIPDLSSFVDLESANFYDNDFTTYTGPVGGGNLHTLGLKNNPNLSGDLGSSLANSLNLRNLSSDGTLLTGGLNPVENVSATVGIATDSIEVTWSPPTDGLAPNGYLVSYSSNRGTTWEDLPEVSFGNTAYINDLADGSYRVRVVSKLNTGLVCTVPVFSSFVTIDTAESGGTNTTVSSGGGVAFWLLLVLGAARYRRH